MAGVFLTDFGLARDTTTGSRYTRTGTTLGTPSYMSPELARGEFDALTPASDVWALGCVLHECLAGTTAFEGDGVAGVIGAVIAQAHPRTAGAPAPVQALIDRCLTKSSGGRPQSAVVLHRECQRVLAGQGLSRSGATGAATAVLATVVGAAALTAVLAWPRTPEPPAPTPASTAGSAEAAAGWELRRFEPASGVQLLQRACAQSPDRHDWQLQLGVLQWAAGDAEAALETWAAVPAGVPLHARARWLSGLLNAASAFDDPAREDARFAAARTAWASATGGDRPTAALCAAGLLVLDRRIASAREALAAIDGWEAALLLALCETTASARGVPTDAAVIVRAYDRALSEGPALHWAFVNRAAAREDLGDADGAMEDLDRALALVPDTIEALYNRARLRWKMGDRVGGMQDLDATVAAAPNYADARLRRSNYRFTGGDVAGALQDLAALLAAHPGHVRGLTNRAEIYRQVGRMVDAALDLQAALTSAPNDADALYTRGLVRKDGGDLTGAIQDFTASLAAKPDQHDAFQQRGVAHEKLGDQRAAAADFGRAIACKPDYAPAWFNRGLMRHGLGELEAAEQDLERAVELDPAQLMAWGALGMVRQERSNWAGAARAYRHLLATDPNHPVAPQVRQWLTRCEAELAKQDPSAEGD